jgi:hypothetical protein
MPTEVIFTAKLSAGTVTWDAPGGGSAKAHRIQVAKGAKPETITIRISSTGAATKLGLRVDCSRPIDVCYDHGECPEDGIDTDQIQVLSCGGDYVQLLDLNTGGAAAFRYRVNVVDKDGNQCPCDPIIQNGGAGPGNLK